MLFLLFSFWMQLYKIYFAQRALKGAEQAHGHAVETMTWQGQACLDSFILLAVLRSADTHAHTHAHIHANTCKLTFVRLLQCQKKAIIIKLAEKWESSGPGYIWANCWKRYQFSDVDFKNITQWCCDRNHFSEENTKDSEPAIVAMPGYRLVM